jgi:PTS system galactitol-specific IIA component
MLRKEFILLDMDCKDSQEAIRTLAQTFVRYGAVKESFVEAVLEREKNYPTGLPAVAFDIAIPHTVSKHVIQPVMAVGILRKPVEFHQMGSPDIILHPQVLFMLAISDPKEQLSLLRRIMKLLQNEKLLNGVKSVRTPEEALQLLQPAIDN